MNSLPAAARTCRRRSARRSPGLPGYGCGRQGQHDPGGTFRASTRPAARYSVSRRPSELRSSITISCGERRPAACPNAVASAFFNRSQYEEVLVVRVNPQILASQKLPGELNLENDLGRPAEIHSVSRKPAPGTQRHRSFSSSGSTCRGKNRSAGFFRAPRRPRQKLEIRTR